MFIITEVAFRAFPIEPDIGGVGMGLRPTPQLVNVLQYHKYVVIISHINVSELLQQRDSKAKH